MDERPDVHGSATPLEAAGPLAEAEITQGTLGAFLAGVAIGLVCMGIVAGIAPYIAFRLFGKFRGAAGWIAGVLEVLGFVALVFLASRTKQRGLAQGVATGGVVAALPCAACWGRFWGFWLAG